jgi:hypothetical protein
VIEVLGFEVVVKVPQVPCEALLARVVTVAAGPTVVAAAQVSGPSRDDQTDICQSSVASHRLNGQCRAVIAAMQ